MERHERVGFTQLLAKRIVHVFGERELARSQNLEKKSKREGRYRLLPVLEVSETVVGGHRYYDVVADILLIKTNIQSLTRPSLSLIIASTCQSNDRSVDICLFKPTKRQYQKPIFRKDFHQVDLMLGIGTENG